MPLMPWATRPLSRVAWKRVDRRKREALLPYVPYLLHGSRFDTSNTTALLQPLGMHVPATSTSLNRILEFARDTNFGRNRAEIARRSAAAVGEREAVLRVDAPLMA
jgi:hypothetical protein